MLWKYLMLAIVASSLYTKTGWASQPPTDLPCQKYSILGKQHTLCWTFDDHPHKTTPSILTVLKQHKIKATFFIVAYPLRLYIKNPQYKILQNYYKWFKKMITDGHHIGNHTLTHANLCKISKGRIRYELGITQKIAKQLGGVTPTLWRPPSLIHCRRARRVAANLGLRMVMADVQDWKRSARSMWWTLRRRVKRGYTYSIVLMHMKPKKLKRFIRLIKAHP